MLLKLRINWAIVIDNLFAWLLPLLRPHLICESPSSVAWLTTIEQIWHWVNYFLSPKLRWLILNLLWNLIMNFIIIYRAPSLSQHVLFILQIELAASYLALLSLLRDLEFLKPNFSPLHIKGIHKVIGVRLLKISGWTLITLTIFSLLHLIHLMGVLKKGKSCTVVEEVMVKLG